MEKPKTDGPNAAEKTAGNNQWTTNNSKYNPDNRERKDGPGGENGTKKQD